MKSKAPALDQGINVLQMLCSNNVMSLDEIAKATGFSKATLLRLLDTFASHGWIHRDSKTKKYESHVQINYRNNFSKTLNEIIQTILEELSEAAGCTAEWCIILNDVAEMILKSEPPDAKVKILAGVGFRRELRDELEAVTRIAYAGNAIKANDNSNFRIYQEGEEFIVSHEDAMKKISSIDEKLITYDEHWNNNGVRRYAAGIRSANGSPIHGILSLAESFTPQSDKLKLKRLKELEKAQRKIEKIIEIHKK